MKPHGRRGKVSVYLYNEEESVLEIHLKVGIAKDEQGAAPLRMLTVSNIQKKSSGNFILSFSEITSFDQASELKNKFIFVDRSDIPVSEDEIIVADLGGMSVYEEARCVGKVKSSYRTAAGEVLVIETGVGLIDFPLCDEYLDYIDFNKKIIRIKHFGEFLEFRYSERKKRSL